MRACAGVRKAVGATSSELHPEGVRLIGLGRRHDTGLRVPEPVQRLASSYVVMAYIVMAYIVMAYIQLWHAQHSIDPIHQSTYRVNPEDRTFLSNILIEHSCRTFLSNILTEHSCESLSSIALIEHSLE